MGFTFLFSVQIERANPSTFLVSRGSMKAKIVENFEKQQSAFVTSASMLDDGIIDPRDTRNVLGFALSICTDNRKVNPIQFGVARP